MFLGGLPNPEEDSGRAWHSFLRMSGTDHYHDIVFVVHPIEAKDPITGVWTEYLSSNAKTSGKIHCISLMVHLRYLLDN